VALVAGLRTMGQGTVLFHGPPGTGKTALARHLGEQLERPLLVRYGSELLDKYVGETEKGIAAMFAEAESQNALLFLDEADSFLGSRQGTQHRWEVSHTNELLVRMEGFEGLFLCATNRLEALDPACLRRFAIKVGFRALEAAQALELFLATLAAAGQPPSGADAQRLGRALAAMPGLAPGDFAAVWRRARMLGVPLTADALLAGLEAELRIKGGERRGIGF
jgi:SpoVK/Ycf46/Vps4 family AAA+-type ATPase